MTDAVDMLKLGLKPHEMQVLRNAAWARTQTPNGHFLVSPGGVKAARRMIDRGFLTDVTSERKGDVTFGDQDWLVVKLTDHNFEAMRRLA